jgi:hypothetical protein
MVIFYHEILHKGIEAVVEDGLANVFANTDNEAFIMNTREGFAGDFVDFIEVMKVCCVVILTTVAIAVWV